MSLTPNEILIKNIIKCSADAEISSAEADLLISEFLFEEKLGHKSVSDLKNELNQKYDILLSARNKSAESRSLFESVREKLSVCRIFHERLSTQSILALNVPHQRTTAAHIAYWYSNAYAKEAFDRFGKLFESCDGIAVDSFNAVCERIEDDNTFGVIPIINSGDGRLISFYRMLDKFDLKISAVCTIENHGNDGFTKFALVGKRLGKIDLENKSSIEFCVSQRVSEYICIADLLNAELGEITSIPSLYSASEYTNYITITADRNSLSILWTYIYLFGGDVDLLGFYTEI